MVQSQLSLYSPVTAVSVWSSTYAALYSLHFFSVFIISSQTQEAQTALESRNTTSKIILALDWCIVTLHVIVVNK